MNLTINGEVKHFEDGMNALDIAGKLPGDVKKNALAAKLDAEVHFLGAAHSGRPCFGIPHL